MTVELPQTGPVSFTIAASTVTAWPDPGIAIAASRSGAIGLLNLAHVRDGAHAERAVTRLARYGRGARAVKLAADEAGWNAILERLPPEIDTVVASAPTPASLERLAAAVHTLGRSLWLEVTSADQADWGEALGVAALVARGHEAGGIVGDETTFILLQRLLARSTVPVWAAGGIGLHTAAACRVAGASGVVLESQLLLTPEAGLPASVRRILEGMDGDETTTLGAEGGHVRVYRPPRLPLADELARRLAEDGTAAGMAAREAITARLGWGSPARDLWPLGQDAAFAPALAREHHNVAGIIRAIRAACDTHIADAKAARALAPGSAMAASHGTAYPIVQGPMTRVSDTAAFAESVAEAGGLPFLALALMRGPEVGALLAETARRLGPRPWGIGILGFVPPALREEQLAETRTVAPPFALIAGGRPDQALALEARGIATYLHVPAPRLLRLFLDAGARRFVFEGRECGGHVGPLSSFVLWDTMVDVLVEAIERGVPAGELHVLFAGGVHDVRSAAMVQALAAPLAAAGVRVGVLMGSAYLFTDDAVRSGAIVRDFQAEAISCRRTVLLESGTGHATRCAETPFCDAFHETRRRLVAGGRPADEVRDALEQLNVGRLRVASKGLTRAADGDRRLVAVDPARQRQDGMYMLGQLAALRDDTCSIADLHEAVSAGSTAWLERLSVLPAAPKPTTSARQPVDVAIVGIGCLLPGAPDAATLWHNLLGRIDAITEVPPDRFDVDRYFHADRRERDRIYSRWGGFLAEIPFDPLRYGIPPNALPSIDPMQLLTLEVVRQALTDAGLDDGRARERTSVMLGAGGGLGDLGMKYGFRAMLPEIAPALADDGGGADLLARLPEWTEDSFPGILLNVAAGRVANRFDFGGVNFTVDAACASSLTAVYLAAGELTSGASDVAIAGGVDTVQSPFGYLCFSKTQALSPRGRCRAFDASADGIAISEGLAVVVLKRLADAERDGDRVYAVIKGIAGSSDGRDRSLTAPRPEGQVRVLERAYAEAGVAAGTIGLIEAHGTGTVVGDATEVQSLTAVFTRAGAPAGGCALGSIKSMVGHTKSTAGVAGLIKIALALYHKVLPPTLHVERPNPALDDPASPFFVNTEARPWIARADGAPRRAGVSAFGFGGANAHAVLEEYTGEFRGPAARCDAVWPAELFVWQADSPQALDRALSRLEQALDAEPRAPLSALAAAVASVRADGRAGAEADLRLAIVAANANDLRAKLGRAREALRDAGGPPRVEDRRGLYLRAASVGAVAFLFPGQGSQRPGMLQDLAVRFSDLGERIAHADARLAGRLPRPLSTYIYPPPRFDEGAREADRAAITATRVAQPALGAVEAGACALLARLGVRPDMTAGHSYGEYVALWAAGVLSDEALIEISELRGRVIEEAVGAAPGTMAAVAAPAATITDSGALVGRVWLANLNAPRQTVIAGDVEAVAAATGRLRAAGIESRPISVACAFHSPLMEPSRQRLAEALATLDWRPPRIPVFSNALGARHPDEPTAIAACLAEHLTRPVRFVEEIEAMYDAGARLFLEVGPGATLAGLARRTLEGREATVLTIEGPPERDGLVHLLHTLGRLAVTGVPVDVEALFQGRVTARVSLDGRTGEAGAARAGAAARWLVSGGRARPAVRDDERPAAASGLGSAPVESPRAVGAGERGAPSSSGGNGRVPASEPPGAHLGAPVHSSEVSGVTTRATPDPVPPTRAVPRGEDEVLIQFQQVMRQFLETQSSVMTSFFQGRSAVEPSAGEAFASESALASDPLPAPPADAAVRTSTVPAAPAAIPASALSPLDRLLQIVSDRTGYPQDMLDVDADIEADLGIDSIKRVEILTTFQREAPPGEQPRLQGLMDHLARLKTLRDVSLVLGPDDDPEPPRSRREEPPPTDRAERRTAPSVEPYELPRVTVATIDAPLVSSRGAAVPGRVTVITDEGRGIAVDVMRELAARGERPVLVRPGDAGRLADAVDDGVYEADVVDPVSVARTFEAVRRAHGPIDGVLHLLPLAPCPPLESLTTADWRRRVDRDLASLYALVRAVAPDHGRPDRSDAAFVAAATGMGGSLGTVPSASLLPTQAGVAAAMQTLALELPVPCRTIDLDPAEPPAALARLLVQEIAAGSRAQQVGYQGSRRVTIVPVRAPLGDRDPAASPIGRESVVLLTGGARGITAEIAHGLATRFEPTLVLVGRQPEPSDRELEEAAEVEDAAASKAALTARLRDENPRVRPAEVERAWRERCSRRETARNLAHLLATGSRVRYRQADVRDEAALKAVIDDIYGAHGRLDVVIHGAGVIDDRLIADKTPESFDRVLHTKADSVFLLSRWLRPEGLAAFVLMSSVTATFGNRGQVDYAAANGVLNGFAARLSVEWPGRVVALNWGPWDGSGMASAEVRERFRARGIVPIPAAAGVEALIREIAADAREAVVALGEGPWLSEARSCDPLEKTA